MTDERKKGNFNFLTAGTSATGKNLKPWELFESPRIYKPFDSNGNIDTQQMEQIKKEITAGRMIVLQYSEMNQEQKRFIDDSLNELFNQTSSKGIAVIVDSEQMARLSESSRDFMGQPTGTLTTLDDLPKTISDRLKPPGK